MWARRSDNVGERLVGREALDLLGDHERTLQQRLRCRATDVGGEHDVLVAQQRRPLAR